MRLKKASEAGEAEQRAKAKAAKAGSSRWVVEEEEDKEDEDRVCWGCTSQKVECVQLG